MSSFSYTQKCIEIIKYLSDCIEKTGEIPMWESFIDGKPFTSPFSIYTGVGDERYFKRLHKKFDKGKKRVKERDTLLLLLFKMIFQELTQMIYTRNKFGVILQQQNIIVMTPKLHRRYLEIIGQVEDFENRIRENEIVTNSPIMDKLLRRGLEEGRDSHSVMKTDIKDFLRSTYDAMNGEKRFT